MKKSLLFLLVFFSFIMSSCNKNPEKKLFLSIEKYNIKELTHLIKEHPETLKKYNKDGLTPLHYAISVGNEKAMDVILANGVDVNTPSLDGKTPLMTATNSGYYNLVVKLVKTYKADVSKTDKIGVTAAYIAYNTNENEILNFLLKNGTTKNDMLSIAATNTNNTVLSTSLFAENENKLLELFKKNAPLNDVQAFCEKNPVDFSKTDSEGNTILHFAATQTNVDVLKYILGVSKINPSVTNLTKITPLINAIVSKNADNIRTLILAGSSLAVVDNEQQSLLHYAVLTDDVQIVDLILYNNHNVNLKDFLNVTPLDIAANNGNADITKRLLEQGADPNIVTRDKGYTALHFAVQGGNPTVISLLLQFGANKTIPDTNNELPKDLAKKLGKGKLAGLL